MSNAKTTRVPPRTRSAASRRGLRVRPVEPKEDLARSLAALRHSILGPDWQRIERLEDRPGVVAESVGAVLPEAVAEAAAHRPQELEAALEPTITEAVVGVARRRPDIYAEALAPSIMAAVKKAVADGIAVLMQRFNVALERSLTLRAVQWRIEAARTGRPFAEIALLRTLVYRVEQVLLIHTPTSLVLESLSDPTLGAPPPDQVAAMLSAIEAFGREALGPMPKESHLNKLKLGDVMVWMSHNPSLTLAVVVRGTPPATMAEQLGDTLLRVHVRSGVALREFSGDAAAFDSIRPMLEPLLRAEQVKPPGRGQVLLAVLAGALVVVMAGGIVWIALYGAMRGRRMAAALASLRSTPGIVVTSSSWEDGRLRFLGLRDPLAAAPEDVLAARGLAPARFELAPFVSLALPMVERRAVQALRPPPTVRVELHGRTLVLAGTAPEAWADTARAIAPAIAGVEHVDVAALRSAESLNRLRMAASSIETRAVCFGLGQGNLGASQRRALALAARRARAALQAATDARVGACLVVTGHADTTGTAERNERLRVARASAVGAGLVSLGVAPASVRVAGVQAARARRAFGRCVTFAVETDDTRSTPGCNPGGSSP